MSNEQRSPYEEFFVDKNKQNQETFESVDRGQPELKAEEIKNNNTKNIVIAIFLVIISLIVVAVFLYKLMFSFNGLEEDEQLKNIYDAALLKEEPQDFSAYQRKLEAEKRKKEEEERLRLERLAAQQAALLEQQRKAQNIEPKQPPLGARYGGQAKASTQPARQERVSVTELKHADKTQLSKEDYARLRKTEGDVLGYAADVSNNLSSNTSNPERPSTLGNMLATERHKNGVAYVRHSREFLLMRGTNISCTLLPRVVTTHPSQPTCMVNEDVYSPEGVVLIDRGSKVLGEQRIALKEGEKRTFIAWGDIETPKKVSINIDSMGADQLGGSGIDAWIDNHYAQRFGGAILLSFIDDFFEILANKSSKNNDYNFENSTDNASSMAQIVLENTINIPPTGYVMPARQINIIVARDVDFTHIYRTK